MSCPINPEHIQAFKLFIQACTDQPQILNLPQLGFFKQFIESLGGKVPAGEFHMPKTSTASSTSETKTTSSASAPKSSEFESAAHESDPESDIELDTSGCVPPDTDEPHEMGDAERTVTDEDIDAASEFRSKAANAYSNQEFEHAIELYTEAIKLYPTNALFFAKRGQVFLKLNRPNACIRDCDRALELNCDSAAAYKYRGRANRLLGNWAQAAKDLRQACKIDFDEETDEWLREVTPNAKKIEQHNVKQERKKKERELKEKQERIRRAQEANKKAAEENQTRFEANASAGFGGPGFGGQAGAGFGGPGAGFGGPGAGFGGGAGGAPGGEGSFFSKSDIGDIIGDFDDPEVYAAMMDITSTPANIFKYKDNPKIMRLINKFLNARGGSMPGGGGMPFMGNFGGGGAAPGSGVAPEAGAGFGGIPGFGSFTSSENTTAPPTTEAPKPPKTKLQDEDLD